MKSFSVALLLAEAAAHNGLWQMTENSYEFRQFDENLIALQSDPICGTAWCDETLPAAPKGHPVDYFVPNFGSDPDIAGTLSSVADAEKRLDYKLNLGTEESKKYWHNVAKDTLYNFAPELDADVKTTQYNIGAASEALDHPFEPASYSFPTGVYRYAGEPPHDF